MQVTLQVHVVAQYYLYIGHTDPIISSSSIKQLLMYADVQQCCASQSNSLL